VLERHPRPGLDTSTHNSGVIHAGIYYPPGTLKARLCVEGARLLYDFCARHGIPHRRCGKLVVAHGEADRRALEALLAQARQNGAEGLELVDRAMARRLEPAVSCTAALWSPGSGVVDAEALVRGLHRAAEAAGAIVLPGTKLIAAAPHPNGLTLETGRERIVARQVVHAAGLYADDVSRMLGGETFTIYPCRGEYAELVPARRSLVNGLVYPLPHTHSLGVHLVKTLAGAVGLGPTARFQSRKDDYEDNRLPLAAFLEPAKRLLDGITIGDLRLSGSGIRPKLHPEREPFADFLIRRDRSQAAIIQAAGIESPGLTSCLAIGRLVAGIVSEA
jgi:L-2-hydroxyglutarate oxidase LhgO